MLWRVDRQRRRLDGAISDSLRLRAPILAPGRDPSHQQRRDERGEPDGEARENDMKYHRKKTREQDGIEVHRSFPGKRRARIEPWRAHDRPSAAPAKINRR